MFRKIFSYIRSLTSKDPVGSAKRKFRKSVKKIGDGQTSTETTLAVTTAERIRRENRVKEKKVQIDRLSQEITELSRSSPDFSLQLQALQSRIKAKQDLMTHEEQNIEKLKVREAEFNVSLYGLSTNLANLNEYREQFELELESAKKQAEPLNDLRHKFNEKIIQESQEAFTDGIRIIKELNASIDIASAGVTKMLLPQQESTPSLPFREEENDNCNIEESACLPRNFEANRELEILLNQRAVELDVGLLSLANEKTELQNKIKDVDINKQALIEQQRQFTIREESANRREQRLQELETRLKNPDELLKEVIAHIDEASAPETLRKRLPSIEKDLKRFRAENGDLLKEIERKSAEQSELEEMVNNSNVTRIVLEKEVQGLSFESDVLKKNISKLEADVKEQKTSIQKLSKAKRKSESESKKLEEQLAATLAEFGDVDRESSRLRTELLESRKMLEALDTAQLNKKLQSKVTEILQELPKQ